MNHLIVNKIGGSILKSPNQLKNAVAAISKQKSQSIIIISALYGITDKLIQATRTDTVSAEKQISNIQATHLQWLANAPYTRGISNTLVELKAIFKKLQLQTTNYKNQNNPHVLAAILSTGEKLSSLIFQHYIDDDVKVYYPENIGLTICNDPINGDYQTSHKLTQFLTSPKARISIIPGFYGINQNSQFCLAGRGGSDYTAAFIANEVNAQELIFWKDSNGIQTANPQVIQSALNVTQINLHTLETMSNVGSEILHPKVTRELTTFNGQISFRNPAFGNQILTRIHREESTSGKAIIVEKLQHIETDSCQISVVTRNITAALITIQKLKNTSNGLQITSIKSNCISVNIKVTDKIQIVRNLHNLFHREDHKYNTHQPHHSAQLN